VLHGRRNYAPACRPGLPTGQASSRVRIAPASIGLWSSDALKNLNPTHVLASAHQVRARWPGPRTGGTCTPLPPVCPCRQSICRSRSPNSSQPGRLPQSGSQHRRLHSLLTGEQRRLTLRSRADPPRQGALPGSRARAILRLPGKAPCPTGRSAQTLGGASRKCSMVGATTLQPVGLGYPPARRVRECALPRHRSGFGPRMP
jgi:hypothetical protein